MHCHVTWTSVGTCKSDDHGQLQASTSMDDILRRKLYDSLPTMPCHCEGTTHTERLCNRQRAPSRSCCCNVLLKVESIQQHSLCKAQAWPAAGAHPYPKTSTQILSPKSSPSSGAYRLWVVSNLEEPRPQKLALDGLSERPHCMAVIEPRHTLSGCVEVGALA